MWGRLRACVRNHRNSFDFQVPNFVTDLERTIERGHHTSLLSWYLKGAVGMGGTKVL